MKNIIRTYKIGAFHRVDLSLYSVVYTRETYSGKYHTWYLQKYSGLKPISKEISEKCELSYQKLRRKQKLNRILK